jgi:hypothetical protein
MKGNKKISSIKKGSNYNNEIIINDKNNLKKNITPNIKDKEIVKSPFRSSSSSSSSSSSLTISNSNNNNIITKDIINDNVNNIELEDNNNNEEQITPNVMFDFWLSKVDNNDNDNSNFIPNYIVAILLLSFMKLEKCTNAKDAGNILLSIIYYLLSTIYHLLIYHLLILLLSIILY